MVGHLELQQEVHRILRGIVAVVAGKQLHLLQVGLHTEFFDVLGSNPHNELKIGANVGAEKGLEAQQTTLGREVAEAGDEELGFDGMGLNNASVTQRMMPSISVQCSSRERRSFLAQKGKKSRNGYPFGF